MADYKPRRVKAKITRTVTEIAFVVLDRDGNVQEVDDAELIDYDDAEVKEIITVLDTF